MPIHRSLNERAEPHPASRPQLKENHDKRHFSKRVADPCAPLSTDSLELLQAFFSLFCSRWSLVVLAALAPEEMGCSCAASLSEYSNNEYSNAHTLRRCELEKRLPYVSTKMLTQTLRRLENAGLVTVKKSAEVTLRVEYALTPQGQSFLEPLCSLQDWCGNNHASMRQALELLAEHR